MKIQKNYDGFSVVELLLIVVILGIVGFAGWFVYNSHKKTDATLNQASQESSNIPIPNSKKSTSKTTTTKVLVWDCTNPNDKPTAEPSLIVLACADDSIGVEKLHWTNWTTTSATGAGNVYVDECVPHASVCPKEHVIFPATIILSKVKTLGKNNYFTYMRMQYTANSPPFSLSSYTLETPPSGT